MDLRKFWSKQNDGVHRKSSVYMGWCRSMMWVSVIRSSLDFDCDLMHGFG